MALFNSFTFGDVNSEDYGVYISGDSVYDSPARSVDLVQVPGRNGALALDNGYYENIEVTYPAGSFDTSQEEWREKMLGIRNALAAQRGYQKLIDTYHPEHYRLGMFFAGISASPVQYNRAGQFPIRFNCKPQRFLISGDEAVTVDFDSYKIADNDEPYLFRKSGGSSDIGDADRAKIDHLTGGTIAWNQLVEASREDSSFGGLTFTRQSTYSTKISGTANSTTNIRLTQSTNLSFLNRHKYLLSWGVLFPTGCFVYVHAGQGISAANRTACIWACTESEVSYPHLNYNANTVFDLTYTLGIFDLTQMFGSTIADYIYSVEQATAGAGVALAKKWANIVKPYYPYDAGSLVSVNTTGRKVVGKNLLNYADINSAATSSGIQCDAEGNISDAVSGDGRTWTYSNSNWFATLPAGTYTLSWNVSVATTNTNAGLHIYKPDNSDLVNLYGASLLSVGAHSATFTLTEQMTIGIMFKIYTAVLKIQLEFGSTATAYEPYTSQTYAIPSTDLRGVPNLNGTEIEYDGDTLSPNGTINRKYGIVNLGTLTWNYTTNSSLTIAGGYFAASISNGISYNLNKVCSKYAHEPIVGLSNIIAEKGGNIDKFSFSYGASAIGIVDSSYSDTVAFKTAMSGVYLVYERATPTTETVSTYEEVQNVYAGGTEEFIDERTVAVPVGHTTGYFNSEGYQLTNPTNFPAKPLIRVYGNGSVQVGDTIATVQNNADGYVDIDCESMNCYDTTGGRNADVSFSGNDFPELASGDNSILLTGPSRVEITPRWWEL